jgi:hypothetical protein
MAAHSDLEKIFDNHTGNIIHKWKHYFEIYDRHFSRFRNKKITLLEIGVFKGGSLEMWREYFGENCQIIGIDINPLCKRFENNNTKIYIGSQDDRDFLKTIKAEVAGADIVIDDGGHMMKQLKVSFEELYGWVREDGIYLAEDLHTCYWPLFGGGYKRRGSFIEYSKSLVDQLNAWHSVQGGLKVNEFTESTHSIHFYDSIVIFEKRKISKPYNLYSGRSDSEDIEGDAPAAGNWVQRLKYKIYKHTGIDLGHP